MKIRPRISVIPHHTRKISFPDISSILLVIISALVGAILRSLVALPLAVTGVLSAVIFLSFIFFIVNLLYVRRLYLELPEEIYKVVKSVHRIRIVEGNDVFDEFKKLFLKAEKTIRIAGGGPLIGIGGDAKYRTEEIEIYRQALTDTMEKKRDFIIERIQRELNASLRWIQELEELKGEFGERLRIYYDDHSFPDFAVNVFDSLVVFIEVVESDYNKIIRKEGIREVSKALLVEDEKIAKEIEDVFRNMITHTKKFPNCNADALRQKRVKLQKAREALVKEHLRRSNLNQDIIEIQRILKIPDYWLIKNAVQKLK